jgi:hypothetical protein
MTLQLSELFERMDKLGLWEQVMAHPWAFKPKGSVYPYVVYISRRSLMQSSKEGVTPRICLLFLEGWQTFHDFVHTQMDPSFGYYLSPSDVPTIEAVYLSDGTAQSWRHAPGLVPFETNEAETEMCRRMMWELYGIMLRVEADPKLPEKFAISRWGMLCRTEKAPGEWIDEQVEAPKPQPYEEHRIIPNSLVTTAKSLPIDQNFTVEIDFLRSTHLFVRVGPSKPRHIYSLFIVDAATGKHLFNTMTMVDKDLTLKKMVENIAGNFLQFVERAGSFPGTVFVCEQRVFRQLRVLTKDFPFKLVMRDELPHMEKAFDQWERETANKKE